MNFREKSANVVSGLEYHEQEREPCALFFSRLMEFNFILSPEIALSEVVSVVQETILGDQHTSVLFLKDLRRLYQERLKYLGADEDMIKNVDVERVKKQLFDEIPGL